MGRLRRRITTIRSAAEAQKKEMRPSYYTLRQTHVEEPERCGAARRAAEENGEEVEEEEEDDEEESGQTEREIANEEEEGTLKFYSQVLRL